VFALVTTTLVKKSQVRGRSAVDGLAFDNPIKNRIASIKGSPSF
jgi:hypothetical protein